ncbi:MAG: MotA/TolQ/ExbB proton channel family protein [Bacteroidales bacterium]|nr:MotA/TolQ/ExbB proton channel family protein [Bacteroidales bacterium]
MQALQNFFLNEWYFALPMTLMSLVAFALVTWRFLLNQAAKTDVDTLLPDLQNALKKQGVRGAIPLCQQDQGYIAQLLFVAGLEAADQGVAAMRRSMASVVELEIVPRLNFLLAPILAIAKIATMVGLLGTVISMINTFNAISNTKAGDTGGMAGHAAGIGLALFATAMGLMTAIPLVFCHVMFKDWITRYEVRMKSAAQKLIVLVQNTRSGRETTPTRAATPAAERS